MFSVTFSYCIDSENRNISRPQTGNSRRDNNQPSGDQQASYSTNNFQYTLSDIPKLAEQAANMYAQNPSEKDNYIRYYTDFYTKQISQVNSLKFLKLSLLTLFHPRVKTPQHPRTPSMKLIPVPQSHSQQSNGSEIISQSQHHRVRCSPHSRSKLPKETMAKNIVIYRK